MKTIHKTLGLLIALTFGIHPAAHAQLLGPYGTAPITVEVDANGIFSDTGTYGTGSLSLSLNGAGTRMIWYPGKAAFRAGNVTGTDWDDGYIGAYSVAMGQDTFALGLGSFVMGVNCSATSDVSIAMGRNTTAAYQAVALGDNDTAANNWTVALGATASAIGFNSVAIGSNDAAIGVASHALGTSTNAQGNYSTTLGDWTTANSYNEVVMGQNNLGYNPAPGAPSPSATAWVSTDPLFEVGNGIDGGHPSDALIVYKNGTATLQGQLTVAPGGDIPMYTGN